MGEVGVGVGGRGKGEGVGGGGGKRPQGGRVDEKNERHFVHCSWFFIYTADYIHSAWYSQLLKDVLLEKQKKTKAAAAREGEGGVGGVGGEGGGGGYGGMEKPYNSVW